MISYSVLIEDFLFLLPINRFFFSGKQTPPLVSRGMQALGPYKYVFNYSLLSLNTTYLTIFRNWGLFVIFLLVIHHIGIRASIRNHIRYDR